tara:strand:- start:13 stop:300 length:288 start_codon:yes stop_codon:yes gene_type:complete
METLIENTNEKMNLKNILQKVIFYMEIAEEMTDLRGVDKREYVYIKMKSYIGELFISYKYEIDTIIESVIFISKAGELLINKKDKIKSSCFDFLK